MTMLFSLRAIKKDFGESSILKDINLDVGIGERIGLVGNNGAGKTTLANIVFGSLEPDKGDMIWYQQNIKIGYLLQSTFYTSNAFDTMLANSGSKYDIRDFLEISSHLGMENVQEWDTKRFDRLSGGEKTKLALAHIWALKPNLLILDEPTNHLDFVGVQWLIEELKRYNATILIISHDRYFLDKSVERIIEIEDGIVNNYKGNYSFYRDEKRSRYESQFHKYLVQEKNKEKISRDIDNLKNWSSKAHRESRKKAREIDGKKEYFRAKAKKKDKQVKSKLKRLEKIEIEGVKRPKTEQKINFAFDSTEKMGKRILEAKDISKSYGNRSLFKDSSFYIKGGERIGILGCNGCGKTTLIKIIMGEETVDSGELFISPSAKISYLSQDVLDLDNEKTVIDTFDITSREKGSEVRTLLANMGFDEEMIKKPVKALSLGERTRVKIVKLILNENNMLILDEPTNHLDLHSRERLEETLEEYPGTILIVSHDRYMLERICSRMLIFKDNVIQRSEYSFKEYLNKIDNANNKKIKTEYNTKEESLVIENRIAYILGELSKYTPEDSEYIMLDSEFKELIKMKRKS
ncbi:ribosomal protection-like ABC-F family protein [Wukongibacter sp. M2B1]|uniref:ribosomal protection-like ABC-F family protein n=1 Tax=Wukongibacter sp. M2B1 TaxID=3088895 RepID=UPI003D7995DC